MIAVFAMTCAIDVVIAENTVCLGHLKYVQG